jgi:hypothetical protein
VHGNWISRDIHLVIKHETAIVVYPKHGTVAVPYVSNVADSDSSPAMWEWIVLCSFQQRLVLGASDPLLPRRLIGNARMIDHYKLHIIEECATSFLLIDRGGLWLAQGAYIQLRCFLDSKWATVTVRKQGAVSPSHVILARHSRAQN